MLNRNFVDQLIINELNSKQNKHGLELTRTSEIHKLSITAESIRDLAGKYIPKEYDDPFELERANRRLIELFSSQLSNNFLIENKRLFIKWLYGITIVKELLKLEDKLNYGPSRTEKDDEKQRKIRKEQILKIDNIAREANAYCLNESVVERK